MVYRDEGRCSRPARHQRRDTALRRQRPHDDFASGRGGASLDIYEATRASIDATWATPSTVAGVDSVSVEKTYTPCGGMYLVIVGGDIYEGTVGNSPTVATVLDDAATSETGPYLTPDCLTVYFASPRDGGISKIYRSSRASITSAWSVPAVYTDYLVSAAVGGSHEDPWFSDDGTIFSFAANPDGTKDPYIVTR